MCSQLKRPRLILCRPAALVASARCVHDILRLDAKVGSLRLAAATNCIEVPLLAYDPEELSRAISFEESQLKLSDRKVVIDLLRSLFVTSVPCSRHGRICIGFCLSMSSF